MISLTTVSTFHSNVSKVIHHKLHSLFHLLSPLHFYSMWSPMYWNALPTSTCYRWHSIAFSHPQNIMTVITCRRYSFMTSLKLPLKMTKIRQIYLQPRSINSWLEIISNWSSSFCPFMWLSENSDNIFKMATITRKQ